MAISCSKGPSVQGNASIHIPREPRRLHQGNGSPPEDEKGWESISPGPVLTWPSQQGSEPFLPTMVSHSTWDSSQIINYEGQLGSGKSIMMEEVFLLSRRKIGIKQREK